MKRLTINVQISAGVVFNRTPAVKVPEGLAQSTTRPFFNRAVNRNFDVRSAGDVTEIELYDEIGFWGVDAKQLRSQLRSAGDVKLMINSPGGDVFDGIAMYNDLVNHQGRVEVEVTGIAASAASLIAMAGDRVTIAENAFFMIHNAWTLAMGDRHALGEMAGVLSQVDAALAGTYAARTGMDIGEIAEMLDAETWLSGADAVEAGFADEVSALASPSAKFDMSGFRNAPKTLPVALEADGKGSGGTIRDVERSLRDAGFSRSEAKAMAAKAMANGTTDQWDADPDAAELIAGLSAFRQKLIS